MMLRMRRWSWALVALLGAAGCGDECETKLDCSTGQVCEAGKCVIPVPRGGGRTPPSDAGQLDAQVVIRSDGGEPGDAGPRPDGGGPRDGGVDGGAGTDGGVVPALTSRGFVWAGEVRSDGGSAYHAYGELVDESAATYSGGETTYADGEGGQCVLRIRHLTSGAPTGYAARDILVIPGPQPNATFAMFPVGGGRFEPLADPVTRMYSQSANAQFLITTDGSPGAVDTVGGSVAAPPAVLEINPPEGGTFFIAANPALIWVPSGAPEARITAELFSLDREVVLTCVSPDDGTYQMPMGAVSAFVAATPTPPFALEIRHDRQSSVTAVAGGRSFPVTFRASWGARFSVQ